MKLKDGTLRLVQILNSHCPKQHVEVVAQRFLVEYNTDSGRWEILAHWHFCPVCTNSARSRGKNWIWPATISEAYAAYEQKVLRDADWLAKNVNQRVLDQEIPQD